jgi:nucleoside-diphosphate-sugar epimerase
VKVFVTGGSGFVGGHAIERLAKSHEVHAMARSDRSADAVKRYGATPVRADLDNVEARHLEGCEAVVHAAAFVEEWGTREQFWQGNVEGTTRMLDVAKQAGVRRFVHIGTEAALFDGHDLVGVDERHPYPTKQRFLYSETKAEAERRVLAANSEGFVTIGLRPRLVWGPRDATILPAVLAMAKEGAFVWLDHGRAKSSTVHVFNVAAAIELALTKGVGGNAYFIADDGTRTIAEFLKALLATQGVTLTDRNLPGAIARPLASALEAGWRALGIKKKPPLTAFAVAMMSREITVDTSKAKRELGYVPVIDVEAGLASLPPL